MSTFTMCHLSLSPTSPSVPLCLTSGTPVSLLSSLISSSLSLPPDLSVVGVHDFRKDIHFPLQILSQAPAYFSGSFVVLVSPSGGGGSSSSAAEETYKTSDLVANPSNTLSVTGYQSPLLLSTPATLLLTNQLTTSHGLGRVVNSFVGQSVDGLLDSRRFEVAFGDVTGRRGGTGLRRLFTVFDKQSELLILLLLLLLLLLLFYSYQISHTHL